MKRIKFILLFVALLIICFGVNAFATESANIGGNDIAIKDTIQDIPIYLTNNPGIMGYKIIVEYPNGVKISNISRGTLCAEGNFNTSLENHKDNKIEIVWNNVENVIDDGSLFVISLETDKSVLDKELKLSYSQDDTFDENWKDVALFCTGLTFVEQEAIQTNNLSEKLSDKDYDYIKTIVNDELENIHAEDLKSIPENDKKAFVESVSEKLIDFEIKDLSDIEYIYTNAIKNGFIATVQITLDNDTVCSIINDSLEEFETKDIDNIDENEISDFNNLVYNKLNQENPDSYNDFENLDEANKFEAIKMLHKNVSGNDTSKYNEIKWIIIAICVAITVIFVVVIVLIKRKKCGGKNEESNIVVCNHSTNVK